MRRDDSSDLRDVVGTILIIAFCLAVVIAFAVLQDQPAPIAVQSNRICAAHRGVLRIEVVDEETIALCRDGHTGGIDQ